MATAGSQRVKKHRDALRAAGLRPVQIWLPDTRAPGFAEEYRRQSRVVAAANEADKEFSQFWGALTDEMFEQLDRDDP